jgi:hypothetical protein
MKIATIQKVAAIEKIDSMNAADVTLANGDRAIDFGAKLKIGELCVHINAKRILEGRSNRVDFPNFVVPISVLEGPDEMKIGISQQPWGDQLQLGPYDNAVVIEEGTDVTHELGLSNLTQA